MSGFNPREHFSLMSFEHLSLFLLTKRFELLPRKARVFDVLTRFENVQLLRDGYGSLLRVARNHDNVDSSGTAVLD